jgi:hypothetical protein
MFVQQLFCVDDYVLTGVGDEQLWLHLRSMLRDTTRKEPQLRNIIVSWIILPSSETDAISWQTAFDVALLLVLCCADGRIGGMSCSPTIRCGSIQ